jgi:hypothetical protein
MWITSHEFEKEKKKKKKSKEEDIREEFRQLCWSNQDLQVHNGYKWRKSDYVNPTSQFSLSETLKPKNIDMLEDTWIAFFLYIIKYIIELKSVYKSSTMSACVH